MHETDLYAPVRDWLTANGYEVRGEVQKCDIAARKGEELIVIELKRRFSTELLVQAIERQRISESVYVAVPAPDCGGRSTRWRGIRKLLKRLEVGLLFCRCGPKPSVEIAFHPLPAQRRRTKKGRMAVLQEIAGRSGDYNLGGSTRRKLVTAYREQAIRIACCLELSGPLAPRKLRDQGTGPKTLSILSSNVYGWFERIGRGVYGLSAQGKAELGEYEEIAARVREDLLSPKAKAELRDTATASAPAPAPVKKAARKKP